MNKFETDTVKQIKGISLTFQAIQAVRTELALHAKESNELKAMECLARLSNLYASIDAKEFIECINELENMTNVTKVNFYQEMAGYEFQSKINAKFIL